MIDEYIPRQFKRSLSGHECKTEPKAGLAGQKNGVLLSSGEKLGFPVFLTVDKGLAFGQNLAGRTIAIVIVLTKSNRLGDLVPHATECVSQISQVRPGQVVHVRA